MFVSLINCYVTRRLSEDEVSPEGQPNLMMSCHEINWPGSSSPVPWLHPLCHARSGK